MKRTPPNPALKIRRKKVNPIIPLAWFFLFFFTINGMVFLSCNKPTGTMIITPVIPPGDSVPVVKNDTVTLIRKLEEIYQASSGTHGTTSISFYYDNKKRVSTLGIKNFIVLFDTGTVQLNYNGNETKPFMIISPNLQFSQWGSGTMVYDTCYFFYNTSGLLIKDSTYETANVPGTSSDTYKQLSVRDYINNVNNTLTIQVRKKYYGSNQFTVFRNDTVKYNLDTTFQNIKVSYPIINSVSTANAIVEGFQYSVYVNPLSKLNISGLHYSWIRDPNDLEILGNSEYKTVSNTNILPRYIDFASPRLPTRFFNDAYNSIGGFLQGDEFDIQIIAYSKRSSYPAAITVTGSTSYPGDAFMYNYYY